MTAVRAWKLSLAEVSLYCFMSTKCKSLLTVLAAVVAATNSSCASHPAQPRAGTGPVPRSQYHGADGDEAQPASNAVNSVPAPAEKIGQTVFPIPDILCAGSPNANKATAEHLEDTIAAALNDLRKPGRAKTNTPGGPVVKVHPEPGIVAFSGTWEETELVRTTLKALKDTAQERQSMDRERAQRAKDEANRKEAEYAKPMLPIN